MLGLPSDVEAKWLRQTFALASESRERGDQPFAAILVGANGELVLEELNTRNLDRDIVAHAEVNLVRRAVKTVRFDDLPSHTLYSSTEPCMMCAGVIAWSGIGTVVFGCSQRRLNMLPALRPPRFRIPTDLHLLLAGLEPPVTVRGPLLEDEAIVPHAGYWAPPMRDRRA